MKASLASFAGAETGTTVPFRLSYKGNYSSRRKLLATLSRATIAKATSNMRLDDFSYSDPYAVASSYANSYGNSYSISYANSNPISERDSETVAIRFLVLPTLRLSCAPLRRSVSSAAQDKKLSVESSSRLETRRPGD